MVLKRIKIRSSDRRRAAKIILFNKPITLGTLIEAIVHKLGLRNDYDRDQDIEEQFELCLDSKNLVEEVDEIDNGDEIVLCKKKIDKKKAAKTTTSTRIKPGEYNAVIPVTEDGLLLKFKDRPEPAVGPVESGEVEALFGPVSVWPVGSTYFKGYYQHPDGSEGPAELNNLIRGVGDKVIAVDGISTTGRTFDQVMTMIQRKRATQSFVILRFQEYKIENKEDDDSTVEDVTDQFLEQRRSKRKIIDLSSDDKDFVDKW